MCRCFRLEKKNLNICIPAVGPRNSSWQYGVSEKRPLVFVKKGHKEKKGKAIWPGMDFSQYRLKMEK